ncbi:MAG: hypothetical protein ACFFBC_12265 [Promethearchaeota archaeon]
MVESTKTFFLDTQIFSITFIGKSDGSGAFLPISGKAPKHTYRATPPCQCYFILLF